LYNPKAGMPIAEFKTSEIGIPTSNFKSTVLSGQNGQTPIRRAVRRVVQR